MTEAALIGSWHEVSIPGYHGPLTSPPLSEAPVLRFATGNRWTGSDGCNDIGGTYELGTGGAFHLVYDPHTLEGCGPNLGPQVSTAARIELLKGRLTFFDRDGNQLAQYERATVTARLVLLSTTMSAGSSVSGRLIVDNNTGEAVHVGDCGFPFQVALTNSKIYTGGAWAACIREFTIPVGRSSYAVPVRATYLGCGGRRFPACVKRNGHLSSAPLPPGQYEATLFQASNVVPTPPLITVHVTPAR